MSSPLPLFYKKIVPLNKTQHRKLYIEPLEDYAFAAQTNSLYIAAVEFPRASHEYPIVFARDQAGGVFPVALLGVEKNQNLFVDKKGAWSADYIPAYARRYPFILAAPSADATQQFTVCIDQAYAGFNTAKEGQALFDSKGKESELLKKAIDFLKDYQTQVALTNELCKTLQTLALLEPMEAHVNLKSGKKHSIGGFQCVSRDKLKALPADKLAEMLKRDQLELIYAHLHSLSNLGKLTAKLQ